MLTRQAIESIIKHFSDKLNYTFKKPELLLQALTRESARGVLVEAKAEYFEPLEFLGDRALNMAVANELFVLNKGASPNELNTLYVNFTRNSDDSKRNGGPLYRVAKVLELENFIIKSPAEDLAKHGPRGKKLSATKKTRECHLSDHVEALIGALYSDSDNGNGSGMAQVVTFVKHYWRHMGLNEECLSESSFGDSVAANGNLNADRQVKLNNIFINSAKIGNWPQALHAFKNGAEIETVDSEQKTALLYFSAWGNCEAVSELIESGGYIEHKDINGWTAVLHAAAQGRFQSLRLLLSEGASVNIEVVKDNLPANIPTLAVAKGSNQIILYITINYLYAFSEAQLQFAATQAKEKSKVHVTSLIKRALQQKINCDELFKAVEDLLKDSHDKLKMKAVKDSINNAADVRVRNGEQKTIFHLLGKLDTRIELLTFILKTRTKLDGIILSDIEDNIFQVDENDAIETLENISFKYADLTGFNFKTIKKFTNVDFAEAILCGVTFHPDAVFVNTNFKNALVDEECPVTQGMDKATLNSLPAVWKKAMVLTTEQKFATGETATYSLFTPASVSASISTSTPSTGLNP